MTDRTINEPGGELREASAKEPAADPRLYVAHLDDAGVYLGVIEKHVEDRVERDVPVPADCDLTPGRYRWNGKAFVPLSEREARVAGAGPSLEQALHDYLRARETAGDPLPPRTAQWLAQFGKTIDAR